MSHSHANVAPPDIKNRRAATVVAGVHTLIILLPKISAQRYHPVGAFLVRAGLVRPESWRAHIILGVHGVGVVGPTFDRELGRSGIGVLNLEERHRWKIVIYGDGNYLCECSRFSFHGEPLTLSESVLCMLAFLRDQEKSVPSPVCGCHRLRGTERPHHRFLVVETGNHAAAQAVIKFNSQIAALNLRLAGWGVRSRSGRARREHTRREHNGESDPKPARSRGFRLSKLVAVRLQNLFPG